jgi:murein endopeptidase
MHKWLPFPPIRITKDRKTLFAPGILIGTIEDSSGNLLSRPAASHLQSGLPHDIYQFYCSVVKPRGMDVHYFVQAITASFAKLAGYDDVVKIAQALFDPNTTMMNTSTRA